MMRFQRVLLVHRGRRSVLNARAGRTYQSLIAVNSQHLVQAPDISWFWY